MKTKHTPGPWTAAGPRITCRDNWNLIVAILPTTIDPRPTPDAAADSLAERDANAARIVTCVNACEGINPEAVPELLALAERTLAFLRKWHGDAEGLEIGDMARAAIAKATGGGR